MIDPKIVEACEQLRFDAYRKVHEYDALIRTAPPHTHRVFLRLRQTWLREARLWEKAKKKAQDGTSTRCPGRRP